MMFDVLKNPKTEIYNGFKDYIKSPKISYYYYGRSVNSEDVDKWTSSEKSSESIHTNIPYYSHEIVMRPDGPENSRIPKITSDIFPVALQVCDEILNFNGIEYSHFLRMNINVVHPQKNIVKSIPHIDHYIKHRNLIIYFTDSGGKTFVENQFHDPKEDDVIIFDGAQHFMETPEKDRRIILVATLI